MKGRMFAAISAHKKCIGGEEVEKVIVANADSEHAPYYLSFMADKKITYSLESKSDLQGSDLHETKDGVDFTAGDFAYHINILGGFNVINALPAIAVAKHLGVKEELIAQGLQNMKLIPGRMEVIDEGQNYKVIVDYAHEKESMSRVLAAGRGIAGAHGKVIVLLGAEGGGRDKNKRAHMGELVGKLADYVVVSNVDPYEDDPTEIVEDIARVAEQNGKTREHDLFVIEDRRSGIAKALSLAEAGDVVLITGKGAEQSIVIGGALAPWDDRTVVREELLKQR
jgi:UDP-N-acetylmuramoyl-L-alanyl-D-glutamate--2,6-diaminopimelate ligase